MRHSRKVRNRKRTKDLSHRKGWQNVAEQPVTNMNSDSHSALQNFIGFSEARRDPEKYKVWRQQMLDWLKQESAQLEELILQYNSFDLIANLMMTQLPFDPETFDNSTHPGLAAIIEHVTLLYLKHNFNIVHPLLIGQVPLEEINNKVRSLHIMTGLYYGSERVPTISDDEPDAIESLRYRIMASEMTVRSPGYEHHQRELLLSLFAPFSDWMIDKLGFCASDIIKIEDAIPAVTSRQLLARFEESKRNGESLFKDVQEFRRRRNSSPNKSELVQELGKLSLKKAKARIRAMTQGWFLSFAGSECFSFSAGDIATEAKIPLDHVIAALRFFSLEFGSIPSDYILFTPTHQLRDRPIIHNQGAFLYPVPGSIIWAFQQRLEKELNPDVLGSIGDTKTWHTYEKHRANYLENEAMRLLGATLKTSEVYSNLKYTIIEDAISKTPELDGLIAYDRTLFLIEAKAGTLSIPARGGRRDRIIDNVEKLLGNAHSQALRAKAYIDNVESPVFFLEDGSEIRLDKQRFDRIFLIAVTLQPMDVFNASLHEIVRAGLIEETHLPWAVSLGNLRVITEINEFPTQLVHYLLRRLRINEFKKFYANDELDWFGLYLSRGLYFEEDDRINDATHVMFDASFATIIDNYYFYSQGLRKKFAPKPVQPMPALLRHIILELESQQEANGHSEVVLQLLDWDEKSRKRFSDGIEDIRERTLRDNKLHDCTIVSQDNAGATCFAAMSSDASYAMNRLKSYVHLKKYQQNANSWVGLLTLVDGDGLVHGFTVSTEPWSRDEQLENLL